MSQHVGFNHLIFFIQRSEPNVYRVWVMVKKSRPQNIGWILSSMPYFKGILHKLPLELGIER